MEEAKLDSYVGRKPSWLQVGMMPSWTATGREEAKLDSYT
jgi:hypothetical protein